MRLIPTSITTAPGLIQSSAHHLATADSGEHQIRLTGERAANRAKRECAIVTVAFQ